MGEQPPPRSIDGICLDSLCDVLAHRYRRDTLSVLQEQDEPMHLADLAREIARLGDGETDDRERIYVALYHIHVPKLADAGFVTVNQDRKTVELNDKGELPLQDLFSF